MSLTRSTRPTVLVLFLMMRCALYCMHAAALLLLCEQWMISTTTHSTSFVVCCPVCPIDDIIIIYDTVSLKIYGSPTLRLDTYTAVRSCNRPKQATAELQRGAAVALSLWWLHSWRGRWKWGWFKAPGKGGQTIEDDRIQPPGIARVNLAFLSIRIPSVLIADDFAA